MLCYKDMSFCLSGCTNTTCHRHFGPTEEKAAEVWWGGPDAPVAFMDFSGDCSDYVCVEPK